MRGRNKHTKPSASKRRASAASVKKKRERRPKKATDPVSPAQSPDSPKVMSDAECEKEAASPPFIDTTVEPPAKKITETSVIADRTTRAGTADDSSTLKKARSWLVLFGEHRDDICKIMDWIKWFFLAILIAVLICLLAVVMGPAKLRTIISGTCNLVISWLFKLGPPVFGVLITALLGWLGYKKSWFLKMKKLKLMTLLGKKSIFTTLGKEEASKRADEPPARQDPAADELEAEQPS